MTGLAPETFKYYYMGLYYQDCQKSVYKANFRPSMVTCPYTFNYVYLTEEVKQKIDAEKKPRLVPDETPISYPTLTKNQAKEKGLRTTIKMENGNELSIYNMNKAG